MPAPVATPTFAHKRPWTCIVHLVAAFALLLAAGPVMAGATMYSPSQLAALEQLAQRDNFAPSALYTGVADPVLRDRLNANIHACVRAVAKAARDKTGSDKVIALIKHSIGQVPREQLETEDAEHYALGYEAILDALGIDSSEGVLNDWMYGLDFGG